MEICQLKICKLIESISTLPLDDHFGGVVGDQGTEVSPQSLEAAVTVTLGQAPVATS